MRAIGLILLLFVACILGAFGFGGIGGNLTPILQIMCVLTMSEFLAQVAIGLRP